MRRIQTVTFSATTATNLSVLVNVFLEQFIDSQIIAINYSLSRYGAAATHGAMIVYAINF